MNKAFTIFALMAVIVWALLSPFVTARGFFVNPPNDPLITHSGINNNRVPASISNYYDNGTWIKEPVSTIDLPKYITTGFYWNANAFEGFQEWSFIDNEKL